MTLEARAISALRAEARNVLVITWKGGAESVVDLTAFLERYEVFSSLRGDERAFTAVSVGEWGWNAHWTDEMEIAADTLWRLSLEQGADWLRTWRIDRGMTQAQAAAALGVSPRMWRYYESGEHMLPKTVRLAALGHDRQPRAA